MMIRAWRITKAKHASAAFSGTGARLFGGRWNSVGTAMVYVAGSKSLAILEMLVHLEAADLMRHYVVIEVSFDAAMASDVDRARLPKSWRRSPAPQALKHIGDNWVTAGKSAVLRVPSAIVPSEDHFLLNPAHGEFGKIVIGAKERVRFDPRLIKKK